MKTLNYRIIGETPLVMHNGELANPFNPITKAIKKLTEKKKNMTEADMLRLAELEFKGSLYLFDGKPCIPGEVWEATLRSAARATRKGKDVERGVRVLDSTVLEFDGSQNPDELWKDERFHFGKMVNINKSKVYRMRPIFNEWACSLSVDYDESVLDEEEVDSFVQKAGENGYLLEWYGRYGKYRVEKI